MLSGVSTIAVRIREKYLILRLCWCFHQQATVRVVDENTNKGVNTFYHSEV